MTELHRSVKEAPEQHFNELNMDTPTLNIFQQIRELVFHTPLPLREQVALSAAQSICHSLYMKTERILEIETFVQLLDQLCSASPMTHKEVIMWLLKGEDERVFNVAVTVSLLSTRLMELHHVDNTTTKALHARKSMAVEFLSKLLDDVLLNERPIAMRADFAGSLDALGQWLMEEPDQPAINELLQKLRNGGVPEYVEGMTDAQSLDHRYQMEYIFQEWVHLCRHPSTTEKTFASLIIQIHQQGSISTQEDSCLFFRLCVDASVREFENALATPGGLASDAFLVVDALAKLIVLLVKYQADTGADDVTSKAKYLSSILSLVVLDLNHHHVMQGEHFNQRVFFRLFSSILCEYNSLHQHFADQHKHIMIAFANTFLAMQPKYFPAFTFGWLALISHRVFMPGVLLLPDQSVSFLLHNAVE
jgi:CCR4-NOT transcription complex subunit 1